MTAGTTLANGRVWDYAQNGFEPRHSNQRRVAYNPIWDIKTIAANASGMVRFFSQRASDQLVTNSSQAGTLNVYRSLLVTRVLFVPMPGTSLVDLLRWTNRVRFELQIQEDRAYHLLNLTQQPGVGIQGSNSIDNHGAPITGYAADFGQVIIGGGIDFGIVAHMPPGGLKNPNAFQVRCVIEALADKTMG